MLGIVLELLNFENPTIHYTQTIPNIELVGKLLGSKRAKSNSK
jgi:hypothetical protein